MRKVVFVFALVLILSVGTTLEAKKGNWTGFVTDAKCAAAGRAKAEHSGCAEKCIKNGQKAVLAAADGAIYEIANQDEVTAHAGHHVKVDGNLDEATKTITVSKVTMVEKK